jgi:signal transduction histidine kinase
MTRRRRSLVERVVWAVTATVAVFLGLQSVLAYVTLHEQEDDLSDTMLQREVQQIVAHTLQPGLTPTGQLIESTRVSAWLERDGLGGAGMPEAMRRLAPGLYQLSANGRTVHVTVTDTVDGRLTVLLDATSSEARVHQFGYTLLALWLVCVGVTVWIASGVAAIAVGPIVAATRTIARSAPDQTPPTDGDDEAGVLMETFNRFRDHVDGMVERERSFAANLDHEIRTSLTTIRTDAELIGLQPGLREDQRARLERIVASVDEIIAMTASTLSYSAGRTGEPETIDLRDFLVAAGDAMADRAESHGLAISIDVASGEQVRVDRQALLTVVRNLVRNAIEHAAPATLVISGDRRALVFRDDGLGIAPARLECLFDRSSHGQRIDEGPSPASRPGRGLGLTIARRLCDLQGWRIEVRSPCENARGTAFTVHFAADSEAPSTLLPHIFHAESTATS